MAISAPPPKSLGISINLASDELWVVAVTYFIFHIIPLILSICCVLAFTQVFLLDDCNLDVGSSIGLNVESTHPEQIFSYLVLVFYATNFPLWIWVYCISSSGNIYEFEKRKSINTPLTLILLLNFSLVALFFFGIVVIASFDYELFDLVDSGCRKDAKTKFALICVLTVVLLWDIIVALITAFLFVQRKPSILDDALSISSEQEFELKKELWNKRCKTLCGGLRLFTCGLFGQVSTKDGKADYAFDQVSDVLGTFFTGHKANFVDIGVAAMLLRAEELSDARAQTRRMYDSTSKRFDDNLRDRALSMELADFLASDFNLSKYKKRLGEHFRHVIADDAVNDNAENPNDQMRPMSSGILARESAAGLKETRKIHKAAKKRPHFEMKKSAIGLVPTLGTMFLLKLASDYAPFMLGLYGWKLLLYMDALQMRPLRNFGKMIGVKSMTNPRNLISRRRQTRQVRTGDTCCGWQTNAMMTMSNTVSNDMIFASFASVEGLVTPYAVMIDHKLKSVIVGCRGTMSLNDLLTDAMLHPTHLRSCGETWGFDGRGHYAHHGMLRCAQEIRTQLQRTQILHKLFRQDPIAAVPEADDGQTKKQMKDELLERLKVRLEDLPECTDYNLVLVGHSLGAGVASILALLLKNEFATVNGVQRLGLEHPSAAGEELSNRYFCIAYAPPGCVFDEVLSEECSDFILSPVVGKDMVPNLSWLGLQKFRLRVLDALYRAKAGKKDIAATAYRHIPVSKLLYPRDQVPETPQRNELKEQIAKLAKRVLLFEEQIEHAEGIDPNDAARRQYIERKVMQCPGRIIHYAKMYTEKTGCRSHHKVFQPFLIEKSDMLDINMSTRSLLDHFPNYYAFVIKTVYDEMSASEEVEGAAEDEASDLKLFPSNNRIDL